MASNERTDTVESLLKQIQNAVADSVTADEMMQETSEELKTIQSASDLLIGETESAVDKANAAAELADTAAGVAQEAASDANSVVDSTISAANSATSAASMANEATAGLYADGTNFALFCKSDGKMVLTYCV